MPSKPKKLAVSAASLSLPTIPKELIDQFVSGPMTDGTWSMTPPGEAGVGASHG